MGNLLSISEVAKVLGVSESTLRRWEREGRLLPDERTEGGQRRYKLSSISSSKIGIQGTNAWHIVCGR